MHSIGDIMFAEEMQEYYEHIDTDKISASIRDIFRFILRFDEEFAESENNGNWFEISWKDGQIIFNKCSKRYSVEQGDFDDPINYNYSKRTILTITASAEEFANIIIDYCENQQWWKEVYGNRRYNLLNFIPTYNAKIYECKY